MEASAGLVHRIVELAARVEGGEHQPLGADSLLVHPHRNPPAVVCHRGGVVRLKHHPNRIAEPGQVLVYRIVHDFIDQMIQTLRGHAADVHPRPFPHSFQTFQHRNAGGIIIAYITHL